MKHSNPETSSKVNWSILKSFLNDRKIPIIPPLYHSGNFITDFRQKAELFKSYFAEQRSMLQNSSKLPTNLAPQTDQSLTSINFSQDHILKIVQSLNPNKAHVPDKLSIPMIKICGKSGDKPRLKNYRPISLLRNFGKIFERIIYNNISEYLTTNKLLSDNQSGFKPCDSYVHHFFINYSWNPKFIRWWSWRESCFFDISKASDRVWHEGLIPKLNQYGTSKNLLCLIKCFLKNRKQRVVLNRQTSSWTNVLAGISQGSILGPLFVLRYVNDLLDGLSSNPKLFADDTSLFFQLYMTKTLQRKNLIMTYVKLVTGPIRTNELHTKWLTPITQWKLLKTTQFTRLYYKSIL